MRCPAVTLTKCELQTPPPLETLIKLVLMKLFTVLHEKPNLCHIYANYMRMPQIVDNALCISLKELLKRELFTSYKRNCEATSRQLKLTGSLEANVIPHLLAVLKQPSARVRWRSHDDACVFWIASIASLFPVFELQLQQPGQYTVNSCLMDWLR